jgi:homoserine O-acetyltransferase/O-succinyltransferase
VIWIFHALTANSNPEEWWPGLVGPGKLFDPAQHFIVCANMPGSCYGSINALDIDPLTGKAYYHSFPLFTTRDMIRCYQPLKEHLGIQKIKVGIGGSMGGQQLLEWAVEEPELFENIIPLATNAFHSPWGVAFNATQRMAIENDPTWWKETPQAGLTGMKTARAIALISYRNYHTYTASQPVTSDSPFTDHPRTAESYQRYQGEKLAARFHAFSYYRLSQAMDMHNVGRNRGDAAQALQKIIARTLVIAISSDILFPPEEQAFLANHIPNAKLETITSFYGHDGFLLEFEIIEQKVKDFIHDLKSYSIEPIFS